MVSPYAKQQLLPGHREAVKSGGQVFKRYHGHIDPAGGDICKQ
jgi:hypothetical protein